MTMPSKYIYRLLVVCALLRVQSLYATTWHVQPNGAIRSVQEAIDKAKPGDTIVVGPGTYREQTITVNKPVYLRGNWLFLYLTGRGNTKFLPFAAMM